MVDKTIVYGDLASFAHAIKEAAKGGNGYWWTYDTALKYLTLEVDVRHGTFLIKDRDGYPVEMSRIHRAISRWDETLNRTPHYTEPPHEQ